MADAAAKQTDELIDKLEKKLDKLYKQSKKEMTGKLKSFLKSYDAQNKQKKALLKAGKLSQEKYDQWLQGKAYQKKWYEEMINQLTADATLTDIKAMSIVSTFTPEAYAINHNYSAFQIEKQSHMDTSFTLYDAHTVENLVEKKPNLLPKPDPSIPKEERWHQKKLTDAITQGILQGEGIDDISQRFMTVTNMDENAAIRNARTAMTGAQNAGRVDAYEYAESLGIDMKQEWLATLDERTRDTHRMLDGERVKVGDKFSNGCRYPGDPLGDPAEIYNCRCTLVAAVAGVDQSKAPRNDKLGGMSYDEWKFNHDEVKQNQYYIDKTKSAIDKLGGNKTFSGIWKDDVKLSDYEAKKDSIQAKMDYYDSEIDKLQQKKDDGTINSWEEKKLDGLIQHKSNLAEFQKLGPEYAKLSGDLSNYQQQLRDARSAAGTGNEMFSQERKDAALWFDKDHGGFRAADAYLDPIAKSAYGQATRQERDGFYTYTAGSGGHNRPLAGYQKPWSQSGSGWEERFYVGPDKVWIDFEGKGDQIRGLTTLCEKGVLPDDIWLQSGQDFQTLEGSIGLPRGVLQRMSESEIQQTLIGTRFEADQFISTAVNEGGGACFNSKPTKWNIYCPSGSEMFYASDFGAFGKGENEMILQRGGTYEITNAYWGIDKTDGNRRKLFVDVELHSELGYNKFQQDPNEWTGSRKNYRNS